jgi:ubiquinone/menaquinone biosynthesis C-methylase UbiE
MTDWTNETAEWYAANYGDYATNRLAVATLPLSPKAIVVDVGCGTGTALRHAASAVTDGQLIGVDPVPRMLEIARQETVGHPAAARIDFRLGAAEDLPVEDDFADAVFAFDSFDHWQNKDQGLTEILRILRGTGQLVVVKDAGLPDAKKAHRAFVSAVERAGFAISKEERIEAEDVRFTLWICQITGGRK